MYKADCQFTSNSEGGTQLSLINDPTLLKQKENANHFLTSTWQEPQKKRDIPRSQQIRQRQGQQFEGNEEYDYAADPKTGWRFNRQSRGNLQTTSSGSRANLQEASSSSSTWDQTLWRTSSCGKSFKSSKRPKEFKKNDDDVSSIPYYGIKKNSSRGAKHGPYERQRMYHKAKEMQIKLVKKSTAAIHLYLHDGTTTTSTEIRCHALGGLSRI